MSKGRYKYNLLSVMSFLNADKIEDIKHAQNLFKHRHDKRLSRPLNSRGSCI